MLFSLLSCSSDGSGDQDPDPDPQPILPVVSTLAPTFPNTGIRFNGDIQSEGDGYYEKGFCWGLNTNPIKAIDNYAIADGSGAGPFFKDYPYLGILAPNGTYNVRAYVVANGGEIIYGNNIQFTTPNIYNVTISPVVEILSNKAKFSGAITSGTGETTVTNKGFCVSTSPNPTISNSTLFPVSGTTLGEFTIDATNLVKNTIYYVRSYGYSNSSNVVYSSEVSFRTSGYVGASGGYVFYDKGFVSNGWRYMEASPTDLTYNGSTLIKWGCSGTNVFQTLSTVGSGLENTNRILLNCADANCAARICDNYTVNGISDWFLPSRDEIYLMDASLDSFVQLGDSVNQTHWSSSEYNSTTALLVNTFYSFGPAFGIAKTNNNLVRAVRRF